MAADAGVDAFKALSLSDREVLDVAAAVEAQVDREHRIAPPESVHAKRLHRLAGEEPREGDRVFRFKVYEAAEVNAFAMANGSIRFYSGLMDMLDDDELRFVIGHEMGHVTKEHIRKKMQLAYAASAVRKGIASRNDISGDLARSVVGGFVETLMGAQFSQFEEKEADDYGLFFLKRKGGEPAAAVSALRKLATLGDGHSFLASHPAPGKRAQRLELQLAGKAQPIEDMREGLSDKVAGALERALSFLPESLRRYLP